MSDVDSYFPRSITGRLRLAAESLFFIFVGAASVFQWPPAGVKGQGLFVDVCLVILFEMMLAALPLGILGLWWAIAMPEWIRELMNRVISHLDIVLCVFVGLGLCGMIAAAMGWM